MSNEKTPLIDEKQNRLAELKKKYFKLDENAMRRGPGGPGGPGNRAMQAKGGKPGASMATIRRLLSYLAADKALLIVASLMVLVATIANLIAGYILRPIVNDLDVSFHLWLDAEESAKDAIFSDSMAKLISQLVLMGIIYIVAIVASFVQQKLMISVSQRTLKKLREELFVKLQKLPVRYYDTNSHGELMSRFTNDVDTVGEMVTNTVLSFISGVITIVGTLFLMFYTSWVLALIMLVMMPMMVMIVSAISKRSRKFFSAQQASVGAMNGYIEEMVSGQKVVKVFCHEETVKNDFDMLNEDLRRNQVKAQFSGGIMGPVMGNLGQVIYAVTITVGCILGLRAGFDLGGITVFAGYSRSFNRPINELAMQVTTIFSALAGAERVFKVIDEAPETPDAEGAIELTEVKDKVIFENVSFGYVPEKTVLHDISLYAKPGQKVAFVGSTGAGKTTITNLLNRFYDIEEGRITIDGRNIKEYTRDSLRKNIAMVLQDTHLFTGTVRENIRYGRLDATDEEVEAAAKTASAHSFIMRLEKGYDTMLEGDGANLSQGQRQLLNIARAAISKAPILVLDEATSSVDTRTERHIEHGMDRLMNGRTTFVIAHRLSTVRNSNVIIVLEHGNIIERGTHEELLAM
ncbi:MAG: ABC transporter ATP-binding protein, partial [Lachnospiraceae bacterium]|nr:ABC transporter ATP-binding protein [Lachnospiraceae bacterium]